MATLTAERSHSAADRFLTGSTVAGVLAVVLSDEGAPDLG